MIEMKLENATKQLPHPVATARRIAEVAGFVNSDLTAFVEDKGAIKGHVEGILGENRVWMEWAPSPMLGTYNFRVEAVMASGHIDLNNIITFQSQSDPYQWKKFAETIGNILLDRMVHGNSGIPEGMMTADPLDDPDMDIRALHRGLGKIGADNTELN